MIPESELGKSIREAALYSVRATPVVFLWFVIAFVRRLRARGELGEVGHGSVATIVLIGVSIVIVVFVGTFAFRVLGLRERSEIPPKRAETQMERERMLMRLMWIIAAVAILAVVFKAV
jgi:heme/copper-type cytochrome/quinol oxidase subunit 2